MCLSLESTGLIFPELRPILDEAFEGFADRRQSVVRS